MLLIFISFLFLSLSKNNFLIYNNIFLFSDIKNGSSKYNWDFGVTMTRAAMTVRTMTAMTNQPTMRWWLTCFSEKGTTRTEETTILDKEVQQPPMFKEYPSRIFLDFSSKVLFSNNTFLCINVQMILFVFGLLLKIISFACPERQIH